MNMYEYILTKNVNSKKFIVTEANGAVIYLNPFTYNFFRNNLHLIECVDGVRFDGIFMTRILNFFNVKVVERQSFDMTSLAPFLFEHAISSNKSIYFCGGKQEDLEKFIAVIKKDFPQLNIVGYHNGYFDNENVDFLIDDVIKLDVDYMILGLGGIKQEIVASKLNLINRCCIFTCGAFISQTTESLNYYPKLINDFNLRWAYRFFKEPRTIKRVLVNYPLFVFNITLDYIKFKFIKG